MKKSIAIILFTMMILPSSVSALNLNSTSFDRDELMVNVSGSVDFPNTMLTIEVLKPGKDWAAISDEITALENFAYFRQLRADSLGNFSDLFRINGDAGRYSVRVYSDGDEAYCYDNDLYVFNKQDIDRMIDKINSADISDLETALLNEDNAFMLGLDISNIAALDSGSREKFLKNFISERAELNIKSVADIENVIKRAYLVMQINDAADAEALGALIAAGADILNLNDENSYNIYTNEDFYGADRKALLLTKLSGKNDYGTVSGFKKEFGEQALLYACYGQENYHIIGSVIEESLVAKSLNLSVYDKLSVSNKNEVLKKLNAAAAPYSDTDAFENAVKSFANSLNSAPSGGSGGGSGGSGGGSGVVISGYVPNQPAEVNEEKDGGFADMDGYGWAADAVNALKAAGIISGRSETEFCPGENVTREEFLKMLISAMGAESGKYDVSFEDVDAGAWYYDSVCAGVSLNITSGIEENRFGIGMPIIRQDMAVMVYRALTSMGIELSGSDTEFADEAAISDYALYAVGVLKTNGLISGMDGGNFEPKLSLNRASAAQIIYRVYQRRSDNA